MSCLVERNVIMFQLKIYRITELKKLVNTTILLN